MEYSKEMLLSDIIKSFFKKTREIHVGDTGIYKDVLAMNTTNDVNNTLNYIIFTKVKAVALYDDLVEVEILETSILNSCDENVKSLINNNIPKYMNPRHIKWEVK